MTGCGNKSLKCERNEASTKESVIFTFNDEDVVETGLIKYAIKVDKEAIEENKKTLNSYFKETFNQPGYEINISDNKKDTVYVELKFDANKLSTVLGKVVNNTYNKLKKQMEKEDYTCH